jgi:hypothetical protein
VRPAVIAVGGHVKHIEMVDHVVNPLSHPVQSRSECKFVLRNNAQHSTTVQ